ncbi:hypothetical protein BU16DRAFT_16289 [Lophium mytilinum]|uniref:Uncharacterized protein n=1 Tax=Lophium mytilinum TaxID=390894 RepID=A0A6A6RDX8_9PEZI|nr:hypothetical protein BU16DRAFT_16289 [Lophium mytilinum]
MSGRICVQCRWVRKSHGAFAGDGRRDALHDTSSFYHHNPPSSTPDAPAARDKMNWTGGRLQRHSKNAGGGVASRQKQHFAKIRTQLQNGVASGQLPFRPSFLRDDEASFGGMLPPFTDRTSRHVGHSRKHQRRAHRDPASDAGEIVEARNPGSITSLAVRYVSNAVDGGSAEKGKTKMKRRSSHTLLEDDRLETSRKGLLARRDWLGLESSHPVHMKFRTRAEKAKIGKRRKIAGVSPSNVLPPLEGLRDGHGRLEMAPAHSALGDHLRVRIGTDAFVSQRSSTHVRDPPRRESSDTMLFDIAVDADTALAVEGSREPSFEQHRLAGSGYNKEDETALEQDDHQSVPELVGSHSAREIEHETRFSSESIEELHAQEEKAEGSSSEPDCIDEKRTSHLTDLPAPEGRLIFMSVPPASSGSDQPASHVPMDTNDYPSEITASNRLKSRLGQDNDPVDQDPQARQIVDETPWKQFLGISDDEQSHSSASGGSERACLHESEVSTRGCTDARRNSAADMTASRAAQIGNQPGAATWVIARQINGMTTQEYTTFTKPARAFVDEEKENDNRQWQDFVTGSRSSSASDSADDTIMGDKQQSPVHSASGTSMKALYSPKLHATSTSSNSALSRPAASPRLRNIEEARLRPVVFASSSLYNNVSMGSPIAAAYSKRGSTHNANSDVSMAESSSAYETMDSN